MARRSKAPCSHPDLFGSAFDIEQLETLSPDSRLVPYGKYQKQPFEVLLNDPEYALWLMGSQYTKLKQQYPAFFGFLLGRFGAPERTPAHNALQNRFLERTFCLQFALAVSQKIKSLEEVVKDLNLANLWTQYVRKKFAEAEQLANPANSFMVSWDGRIDEAAVERERTRTAVQLRRSVGNLRSVFGDLATNQFVRWENPVEVSRLQFEHNGSDVYFVVGNHYWLEIENGESYPAIITDCRYQEEFRVEVKPLVGDDYPVILRAMKAVKGNCLLVGTYCGTGASWEQVVKVFSLSGIAAVLLDDVERTAVPSVFDVIDVPCGLDSDSLGACIDSILGEK